MATTTITPSIANDTRMVCVFCTIESSDDLTRYCCGEYGAVLTRAEFLDYMGYDFFADE